MTKPLRNETRLKEALLANLKTIPNSYFWRQNTGARTDKDKTGKKRFTQFGIPGQADITGVVNGRRIEIELKVGKEKLRIEQVEFRDNIVRAGGLHLLVCGEDGQQGYIDISCSNSAGIKYYTLKTPDVVSDTIRLIASNTVPLAAMPSEDSLRLIAAINNALRGKPPPDEFVGPMRTFLIALMSRDSEAK